MKTSAKYNADLRAAIHHVERRRNPDADQFARPAHPIVVLLFTTLWLATIALCIVIAIRQVIAG